VRIKKFFRRGVAERIPDALGYSNNQFQFVICHGVTPQHWRNTRAQQLFEADILQYSRV
jgi:hypothetical protein